MFCAQGLAAQKTYQLAPPNAKFASAFFDKSTSVSFVFEQPGSEIRYTTDGSDPTANSAVYKKPIAISKHQTIIKAATFAKGFTPSETVVLPFFSQGLPIAQLSTTSPNNKYKGSGPTTLFDNKSGGTNHNNNAWLGFDSDSIIVNITMQQSTNISAVMLHVLVNQGAWIFAPQQVQVYVVDNNSARLLQTHTIESKQQTPTDAEAIMVALPKTKTNQLRLVITPLATLPEWHAGKGNKAWCFIDEIKIY
ncbi:MAG TPA: FN3 associated domain-containing protein [Phnomibacter sp.]|nr:FN3 associated domain-containing protein [Phnomibacter sp.]